MEKKLRPIFFVFDYLRSGFLGFFRKRSVFELGISAVLYYTLIFFLTPALIKAGLVVDMPFHYFRYTITGNGLTYQVIGLIAIILGYFFPLPAMAAKKIKNPFGAEWNMNRVPMAFWGAFFLGAAAKLLRITGGAYFHSGKGGFLLDNAIIYNIVGFFDLFGAAALLISFLWYFHLLKNNDPRAKKWRWIAWAVFAFEITYALPSCSRSVIIPPFVLYLIARTYTFGMRNWQVLFILALLLAVFLPVGDVCRNFSVNSTIYRLTHVNGNLTFEKAPELFQIIVLGRMNQNVIVSKLAQVEPIYKCGNMFKNFLTILGPPKFLWKSKPTVGAEGNEFGRKYDFIGDDDYETSIGATIVGAWYYYCGFWGIVFGMLGLGALWRIIYVYFIENTARSLSGIMIYAVLWVNIIRGMENEIILVYAGVIKIFIMLAVIHFFLAGKSSNWFREYSLGIVSRHFRNLVRKLPFFRNL